MTLNTFKLRKLEQEYADKLTTLEQEYAEKQAELEDESKMLTIERQKIEKYRQDSINYRIELKAILDRLRERERIVEEREAELSEQEYWLKKQKTDYQVFVDSLKTAEYNALLTLKRADRKEQDYLSDLMDNYEKLKNNSAIVRRRNGFKFEEYIARLLANIEYTNVSVTKKTGDYGADVVGEKDGLRTVFQCKYYSHPVGVTAIQEAYAAINQYHADHAVVVTNNVFSKSARELAKANSIELWDCSVLASLNISGEFY